MDRLLFSELLVNPQDVSLEHKDDLVELTKKYPYFQAPQVLLALSDRTDTDQIKRAAAYSVNRSMLKALINEDFNTNVNLHNARKLDIQATVVNAFEELADKPNYTEVAEEIIEEEIEHTITEEVADTFLEEIVEENSSDENNLDEVLEEDEASAEEQKDEGVLAFLLSNVEEEEKSEELHQSLFSEKEEEIKEEEETPISAIEHDEEDELIVQDDEIGEVWASEMLNRWKGLQQMREDLKDDEESLEKSENQKPKERIRLSARTNNEELPLFNPFGKDNSQNNKNVNTNDSWTFELNKELFPEHLKELVEKEEKMELAEKKLLINNFINEKPRINIDRTQIDQEIKDLSGQTSNHFLFRPSENFAKILVKQGKYKEAVHIYEELILKNPDKKAYFADCISEIKKGS